MSSHTHITRLARIIQARSELPYQAALVLVRQAQEKGILKDLNLAGMEQAAALLLTELKTGSRSWGDPLLKIYAHKYQDTSHTNLSPREADLLVACHVAGCNILIQGVAGSGKTTLHEALLTRTPSSNRLITIDDDYELRPVHLNLVQMATLSPAKSGKSITLEHLVEQLSKLAPDYLAFSELAPSHIARTAQSYNASKAILSATTLGISPKTSLEDFTRRTESNTTPEVLFPFDIIVQMARTSTWKSFVKEIAYVSKSTSQQKVISIFQAASPGTAAQVNPLPSKLSKRLKTVGFKPT